jgi:SP family general alpha glucoside:H+ symporter-like MFS transporter
MLTNPFLFCIRYYVAEIPMIYLASQMLNTTGWNMAGKCGYVWGGTALVCWVMAFFFLPEVCCCQVESE